MVLKEGLYSTRERTERKIDKHHFVMDDRIRQSNRNFWMAVKVIGDFTPSQLSLTCQVIVQSTDLPLLFKMLIILTQDTNKSSLTLGLLPSKRRGSEDVLIRPLLPIFM